MRIRDIPDSYAAFEAYNREFETRTFAVTKAGQRVGNATRDLLLGFYLPRFLWAPARPLVYALMDEPLLQATGYPPPNSGTRRRVEGVLRAQARLLRLWPKPRYPRIISLLRNKTHPQGYSVADIGPPALRRKWAAETGKAGSTDTR
ncbi:MAG: hypothetical protein CML06_02460 [Pseudomonadales bacterium]|nr:hypothetical protein [Pseudomonadales bacterium]